MLVLSRRPNEKIVFPNLGITVQIMRVSGKAVRIGIDAPPEIPVWRGELAAASHDADEVPPFLSRGLRQDLRNRLNAAASGLQTLHRRLESGETGNVEATIFQIFHELEEIDGELHLASKRRGTSIPRSRRALIVEDNQNESELLAAYLRMNGYEVDTVADGLQAILYLKKNEHPDAVLLDMCMPRLNGPKTISSIRCEPRFRGLKLFAVSGANRRELGVDVGPRGVDRWFSKPVDASQLVEEMNRELDEAMMTA